VYDYGSHWYRHNFNFPFVSIGSQVWGIIVPNLNMRYHQTANDLRNREDELIICFKLVLSLHNLLSPKLRFTSMFVERMEVLEYRQKFELELSTFPDSTNTKTPRKLVFSLTCVCVCVCLYEKVCQWISYERVDRFGWKLRCMLQSASNREPPLTGTIGPLFPLNLRRGWFLQFFEPLYFENYKRYRKTEKNLST